LGDVGNFRHSGIALLGRCDQNAVTAHGHARCTSKRALVSRFNLTRCRATGIFAFALVALLTNLDDSITANGRLAYAGLPRCARTRRILSLTVC
jgi:hypothetical protein